MTGGFWLSRDFVSNPDLMTSKILQLDHPEGWCWWSSNLITPPLKVGYLRYKRHCWTVGCPWKNRHRCSATCSSPVQRSVTWSSCLTYWWFLKKLDFYCLMYSETHFDDDCLNDVHDIMICRWMTRLQIWCWCTIQIWCKWHAYMATRPG